MITEITCHARGGRELGSGNCGKTSVLLNSGLKFPLNEQADRHLYQLRATEHCDVLYSNEALFVDTPGGLYRKPPGFSGPQGLDRPVARPVQSAPGQAPQRNPSSA